MESTIRSQATEKTLDDLGAAVREGEHLLNSTTGEAGERTRELRARLQASIDKAKALCDQLQQKTVAAAKATDKAVREHPYQAVGIAFGVGLLIGVLAMRSRRD
jgi:ElaB/YqjD/DUF883 family membrane-anchored ribosome-binding protein